MASLHSHSNYSVIDGRGLIKDYLQLAKEDGQEAFALTDHGTIGGAIDLYKTAKSLEVKPIIGCELYVDVAELRETDYPGHLTVLARNEAGYRSLIAANNLAHRQFYYRPRVTIQQIIEKGLAKDWIILSGCMSSPIYDRPQSEAIQIVRALSEASSAFFLEFMWHPSNDEAFNQKQDIYLNRMADMHRSTNLPMVITNDCHYAHPHHESIHQELRTMAQDNDSLEFDGEGFHFKKWRDMQQICDWLGVPNGWDNAVEIGKMCDIVIPEADRVSWYVPDITGGTPRAKLVELCEAQLNRRHLGTEYWDRYKHELSVLDTSSAILNSYLVTHDLVTWCRSRGIPCAARGSMAGSLVSWLLGITEEDPVKYRLSFSRAVNPARPTIPDFDLDVSSERRPEVLEYLRTKYDNNVPIAAYTHYGPRGALRKVLKMEGLHDFPTVNAMCKELPDDWSDGDFEYSPGQHRYVGNSEWFENVPEKYRDFTAIYKGLYSALSVHPSGILVGGPERPLEHEVPFQWIASSKTMASAFDMYTLKKIGLFKLDVLGLRTLDNLAFMKEKTGVVPPDDNYDEPEVLAAFGADLLTEIFQMDGYACRQVIRSINGINTFEDIVAANTLARPGCAQFTQYYRSGYEGLMNEYPQLREVLGVTNGLILYQEQVMEIARVLADFDDAEQDDVKESIKYFRREHWASTIEPKFYERCAAKGIDATNILEAVAKMASYTFNRAHALTYAAIAYKMMWYKVHYPHIFYAAVYDAADDKMRLVLESHFFKVKWRPADVNTSLSNTTVINDEIVLGLSAIKGVGPAAFEAISAARPFVSLEDLKNRVHRQKCNIRVIEAMRTAYALTSIGEPGTRTAFKDAFGFPISFLDHDLVEKLSDWQGPGKIAGFITDIREITIRKPGPLQGQEMCQLNLVNMNGRKRCVLFPDVWRKAKGSLYAGAAVKFEGQVDWEDFIVSKGFTV